MKKFFKRILIAALVISCIGIFSGFTDNVSQVTFKSSPKYGFVFNPQTDLFQQFKKLMPGDIKTQNITLTNDIYDDINIYLRAEEDYSIIKTEKEKQLVQNLLKSLRIKVVNTDTSNTVVYEGPLTGKPDTNSTGDLSKDILLGLYGSKKATNLSVQLIVPTNLGNEYQSLVGGIKWIFSAEVLSSSSDSDDDDDSSEIKTIVIEPKKYETEVPKDNPIMGTDSSLIFYFAAACCAATGIVLTVKKPASKTPKLKK